MTDTFAPSLGEATLQDLRESVRGEIIRTDSPEYPGAVRVWNAVHDERKPAVLVRCAGAADVVAAVGFARSNDLPLAVRGGGHSAAGFSTCDGGLVCDLSALRHVRVDPTGRRATVGGGATWADVDHETQEYALATTGGLISSTGVGGFTLGGGIGWLMRKHGLACDNLVGADVVTADGRLLHASESEHGDLLWGLRGGGGNFGVVTEFEFALHPVGPLVYGGPIFYAGEDAASLLRLFRDWAPSASDDVCAIAILTTAPPLPAIPTEWHGRKAAALIAVSTAGVEDAGESLSPFRKVATPIADLLGPIPYVAVQSLVDPLWQKGIRAYFKSANLRGLDDELIGRLDGLQSAAPGPQCAIHIHPRGGAVARVPDGATAFQERSMPFVLNAVAGWQEQARDDEHVEWARSVVDAALPSSTGRVYVNFQGDADVAKLAYAPDVYGRLAELKAAYDPTNLFRLNQNIEPAITRPEEER